MSGLAERIAEFSLPIADPSNGIRSSHDRASTDFPAIADLTKCLAGKFFPLAGLPKGPADLFFRSAVSKLCSADFFQRSAGSE